jgi:uncharacterized protein (UPF0261 family)
MKAVPIGVPKLILSTVAYSPMITPDLADTDAMILPWTAGLWGLNRFSMQALETAAGAISGAVEAYSERKKEKKTVAVTSLGMSVCRYLTTLKPALEERGYDVAVFHTTGMSGRLLERAIADGAIDAVLDLSVGVELLNEITGGVCASGKNRLEEAGKAGIPQIVSQGAIEAFHWGGDKPMPAKYSDRPTHRHNKLLNIIISSNEERAAVGKLMAEKLNKAKGPTAVVIPYQGFLHAHGPEQIMDFEDLDPFAKAVMTTSEEGSLAFYEAFMKHFKTDAKVVPLKDAGLNDPIVAEKILELFDEMMER